MYIFYNVYIVEVAVVDHKVHFYVFRTAKQGACH